MTHAAPELGAASGPSVGPGGSSAPRRIVLLGNPNTGKTTLFNRISGLRHKTSNFPGTTLEARVARVRAGVEGGRDADLIDLPGLYSIELDNLESRVCREVLAGTAAPRGEPVGEPECAVVVADATNLARNLMLVGEVLRRRLPTVVVVNMMDLAAKAAVRVDVAALSAALGCEVVPAAARDGERIDALRHAIRAARIPTPDHAIPGDPDGLRHWAEDVFARAVPGASGDGDVPDNLQETASDRADRVLLNPVLGLACFALVMTGLFYTIFSLAHLPMGWIESIFAYSTSLIESTLPPGPVRDLLSSGIVGGIGSTVIFLPQILLLFFLISLLEDTGYLARGAFLMDRLLRPFGLPGQAFVPLLSAHACALPGIMAARAIPDPRERLATILVAPFMTCSARLPVYVLLTTLLFKGRPLMAALAFVGCYALGIVAGVLSALIARRTILRGPSRAMAMELPSYKRPSLRTALITSMDRGWVFLKKAGTVILAICIVLWWLGAYPKVNAPAEAEALRAQIAAISPPADAPADDPGVVRIAELESQAAAIESRHAAKHSFMGMIGRTVQPVFSPLGYDWQLTVGVMTSFAAREVFVATMNIVIAGQEEADDDAGSERLMDQIRAATRDDGVTPVFTPAASWSLLVFFVLAMQCLPTLAVTMRESGHVKWALLQLAWMSGVAYVAALVVFQILS